MKPELAYEGQPLCVDLDGTLIKTDCLVEAILNILQKNPWMIFAMMIWLMRGKIEFKNWIFSRTTLSIESLPIDSAVIDIIKKYREHGSQIVLVTASPLPIAEVIAKRVGLFDFVLGSTADINIAGKVKATLLVERFGEEGFHYMGNSHADLSVWQVASKAIVVRPNLGVQWRLRKMLDKAMTLSRKKTLVAILHAMRPHQWLKNILVFVPFILRREIADVALLVSVLTMFVSFCLVSSSLYLVNDLLDLEADRKHPENCRRPFASGDLDLTLGLVLIPSFLFLGLLIANLVSWNFFLVILLYIFLSSSYSIWLKSIVLLDILVLASLYTIRIFAGAKTFSIEISAWLVTFSGFLFLSLALLKRYSELLIIDQSGQSRNLRRGYRVGDLTMLASLGTASGFISVLVFALYLNSPIVSLYYRNPYLLWVICPVLLYWISRMWLKAQRGEIPSDPLYFTFKDRVSYFLLFTIGIIWILASLPLEVLIENA